mgnify:CR=1 FL=1
MWDSPVFVRDKTGSPFLWGTKPVLSMIMYIPFPRAFRKTESRSPFRFCNNSCMDWVIERMVVRSRSKNLQNAVHESDVIKTGLQLGIKKQGRKDMMMRKGRQSFFRRRRRSHWTSKKDLSDVAVIRLLLLFFSSTLFLKSFISCLFASYDGHHGSRRSPRGRRASGGWLADETDAM